MLADADMHIERNEHHRRLREVTPDKALVEVTTSLGLRQTMTVFVFWQTFKRMGLGRRSKLNDTYKTFAVEGSSRFHSNMGAGGQAVALGGHLSEWPIFDLLLPEIAFAGNWFGTGRMHMYVRLC